MSSPVTSVEKSFNSIESVYVTVTGKNRVVDVFYTKKHRVIEVNNLRSPSKSQERGAYGLTWVL